VDVFTLPFAKAGAGVHGELIDLAFAHGDFQQIAADIMVLEDPDLGVPRPVMRRHLLSP
jgi:hypothetical protein